MELNGPSSLPQSGVVKKIVVFLHGLGADGNDLLSLSDEFVSDLADTAFYSPNAPFACDMAPYGYQWFSLQQRVEEVILEGIKIATPILNGYLDGLLVKHKLLAKDLALVGFSQGTMISLYVAPRRPEPVACVVGYSGAMIMPELLEKEMISKPPICLVHGDMDNVVPYGAMIHAVDALMQNHIPHEAHGRPNLGHGIDEQGITIARNFLKRHLTA
jgi:phospholipase/carboxylesterase